MRILLHDHSGHPFQVELSRALAGRGHDVLHVHSSTFQTPKADLRRRDRDPASFEVEGLAHDRPFAKYAAVRRARQEREYGAKLVVRAQRFEPDALVVCNTPLLTQRAITRWSVRRQVGTTLWLQDLYALAARGVARQRGGRLAGRVVERVLRRVEAGSLRRVHQVVAISDAFLPVLRSWGVASTRTSVVPNWAPLDEIPVRPRDNAWARRHDLSDRFVFLYTGTLGLKHDPGQLVALADHFTDDAAVSLVVLSEGPGADFLRRQAIERGLSELRVLPFATAEEYPDALGSAAVLMALLDEGAGEYSVPSKVLSYQCAGRPVLAAVPEGNQASETIAAAGCGIQVPPGDTGRLLAAADKLRHDESLCDELGAKGRAFAEARFAIDPIATRFEAIIDRSVALAR